MIDKKELLKHLEENENFKDQEAKGKENKEELIQLAEDTLQKVEKIGDIKEFIEILLTMKKVLVLGA
jgi:hypothetical protein